MDKKAVAIVIWVALFSLSSIIFYRIIINMTSSSHKRALGVPADITARPSSAGKSTDSAIIKVVGPVGTGRQGSAEAEAAYWRLAANYEEKRDLLKLREVYREIVEKFPSSRNISKAQEALEETNVRLLFSDINSPDAFIYEVQKGDGLARIAKKFNTTVDLVSGANGLKDGVLRYGSKLKITKLKFSIVVDKSQNILTLTSGENAFKTYGVSTGKNSSTPVGVFKIITKIVDPPWYPSKGKVIPSGDVRNVLGSRWMGISKPSYGIHGTTDPDSIGKSVTDGCVRMKNQDVEELYSIVPEGTEVIIID